MRADLVKSETLPIFVMANSENVGSRITYKPYNKAGSLSDDLVPTSSRCLPKQPRGLASFVTYATNFFPKMANSEKVSADAQGASIATVSARNSAFSKLVQATALVCENIRVKSLQSQKCFASLLLPNSLHLPKSDDILFAAADKAAPCDRFYFGESDCLATSKGAASFVVYINSNSFANAKQ